MYSVPIFSFENVTMMHNVAYVYSIAKTEFFVYGMFFCVDVLNESCVYMQLVSYHSVMSSGV